MATCSPPPYPGRARPRLEVERGFGLVAGVACVEGLPEPFTTIILYQSRACSYSWMFAVKAEHTDRTFVSNAIGATKVSLKPNFPHPGIQAVYLGLWGPRSAGHWQSSGATSSILCDLMRSGSMSRTRTHPSTGTSKTTSTSHVLQFETVGRGSRIRPGSCAQALTTL